jgi:hypothetical protein
MTNINLRNGGLRTYSELASLQTFEERYRYLRLGGRVGEDTFGFDRFMNQKFYRSPEWKRVRDEVIVRDDGCDLGIEDRLIHGKILIHHMNPITEYDVRYMTDIMLNPEYLICVSHNTHNAIHYGDENLLIKDPIIRTPNDTCPWKR